MKGKISDKKLQITRNMDFPLASNGITLNLWNILKI